MGTFAERVAALGLTGEEGARIVQLLGREPNDIELSIFSVMWSEHCSYKSSRAHLGRLKFESPHVAQGPGENAGGVRIGDGDVLIFKIESHNHPSYVEPFQGAATGVGGILRDIFTMGARPIALMNSLRFGDPRTEQRPGKTSSYLSRVVSGIAHYGNCIGVPTVGGEIYFDERYEENVLVNAFAIGLVKEKDLFRSRAEGPGNRLVYLGARTGRDGIHGASLLASQEFSDDTNHRPRVQVADPFTGKRLLEAVLEIVANGKEWLIGLQDMGAAGLTSSSVEMAFKGGSGVRVNLSAVPARETGMNPIEFMLSESQERMLLCVRAGREDEAIQIATKWGIASAVIGEVTDSNQIELHWKGERVAQIPVRALTDEAPEYHRPIASFFSPVPGTDFDPPEPEDLNAIARRLIRSPNLLSRRPVYQQFDFDVGTRTVFKPGGECALLAVKGTKKAVALTVNGNSRYSALNPRRGAMIAVAEGVRSLACAGARAIACSDGLNFGNPERPEIMREFSDSIDGIREACEALNTPVVSGNVSFYNETSGRSIPPTVMIAMVGLLENIETRVPAIFQGPGDLVFLLGDFRPELGGSEYLHWIHGQRGGSPPEVDLKGERNLAALLIELAARRITIAARDCSEGGLFQALFECCMSAPQEGFGFQGGFDEYEPIRKDAILFGEAQGRAVISIKSWHETDLFDLARRHAVPCQFLGYVTDSSRFEIAGFLDLSLTELSEHWWNGLDQLRG